MSQAKSRAGQITLFLGSVLLGVGGGFLADSTKQDLEASELVVTQQQGWRPSGEGCVSGPAPNRAGLEIFGGGDYSVDPATVIVAGEDSLDTEGARGLMGGLGSIRLPSISEVARRRQIVSSFSLKVAGKSVCIPPSAQKVSSAGWCSFGGAGEHGVRFSLHQSLRTEYEGGMHFPGCPPKCLSWDGLHDCDERKLRPGVQAVMYRGLGFPVAKWTSADAQYSLQSADKLYKQAIFDKNTMAANQSLDIMAGGLVQKTVRTGVPCPWDTRQRKCKEYNYIRKLSGTMVRRTYNDLRIGLGADSAGGLQVRANFSTESVSERFVIPGPGTNTSRASGGQKAEWRRQTQYNALFDRFCGRRSADAGTVCGRSVGMPDEATGGTVIAARDDSLRAMQLCSKLIGSAGGDACGAGKNPMAPTAPDDEGTLARMARDRLTEGARDQDTVSAGGKIATGRGERVLENGQSQSMGSQWQRSCRKTFARDSLRAANQGEALGPARESLLKCLMAGGEQ